MFHNFKIQKLLVIGFLTAQCLLAGLAMGAETTATLEVNTGVLYICDQDGICDNLSGENEFNCVPDCGCNNNGTCQAERGENVGSCPADCSPTPGVGGITPGVVEPLRIDNINVRDISSNTAVISWTVTEQAMCQVAWGLTPDYEQGTINEGAFIRGGHLTQLLNLNPALTYHFLITCQNINFNETKSFDQKFTTLALPDTEPPANVSNLEAISGDQKLFLKWQNPLVQDFKEVRIFRGDSFYPTRTQEGRLVYSGAGEDFEDSNLTNGTTYYYTVFSYDQSGNYSSGATVWGMPLGPGQKPPVGPPFQPPVGPATPEVEKINLGDFSFQQGDNYLPLLDSQRINLLTTAPLKIAIDYQKVPEVLKTIMVTLKKGDKYFSFLLRVNKEKSQYTATLLPPEMGVYPMDIYVFDYQNQALKKIDGQLVVNGQLSAKYLIAQSIWGLWLQDLKQQPSVWILMLILLLILAALMSKLAKRIKKDQRFHKQLNYKNHSRYNNL